MSRQTSSISCSDRNGVNATHTHTHTPQPPMKEDPPKLPLCQSLEQPVTLCLQQLYWFTHVQPSQVPPQHTADTIRPPLLSSTCYHPTSFLFIPYKHSHMYQPNSAPELLGEHAMLSKTACEMEIQAKRLHKQLNSLCTLVQNGLLLLR